MICIASLSGLLGCGSGSDSEEDEPFCSECLPGRYCHEGTVWEISGGNIPCSEWTGECPARVHECQKGCRTDDVSLSWSEDLAMFCREHQPKHPGDPCVDDSDCRPLSYSESPYGTTVVTHLACDVAQGACVETDAPVIEGYMDPCGLTLADIPEALPRDRLWRIERSECATGSCLMSTSAQALDQDGCIPQGCTVRCTGHGDCPQGSLCVDVRGESSFMESACVPMIARPPYNDLFCPGEPRFPSCLDGALPADLPTVAWTNPESATLAMDTPWHGGQDVIALPDTDIVLSGHFAHGDDGTALAGERVEAWIDDCEGGARLLGEAVTDQDGRATLAVAASELAAEGEYAVTFRVLGDGSLARTVLRIYPPGTQLVVLGLDRTLTGGSLEGIDVASLLAGAAPDLVPHQDAPSAVAMFHGRKTYEIVYLTGRPYLLDRVTRQWLEAAGFVRGTVRHLDTAANQWPGADATVTERAAYLRGLTELGFDLAVAVAGTRDDVDAYVQAGIPAERVHLLQGDAASPGGVVSFPSFTSLRDTWEYGPAAAQPFRR